eukprot:CAMPEP_0113470966 /NCGR_PEP_ID=MMETSP0014_2-20120614/16729_1 /TAXON_ID=2857 /ORGANISM="Nitzschia sp." /LENGTH=99 /DNA_ID=CAMNT_0000363575 /DNA_START=78 /DNA_END=377 /DNA_ORIENTATION=+ /assembly_acc=CAM_ASM_000159
MAFFHNFRSNSSSSSSNASNSGSSGNNSSINADTPRDHSTWSSTKTIRYGAPDFKRSPQYTESKPDTTTAFKTHTIRYHAEEKPFTPPARVTIYNTIYA